MKILRLVWSQWLRIARRIGVFESRLLLTLFYFTLLLPLGLLFSLLADPFGVKTKKRTAWTTKIIDAETVTTLREQF
jgi:hypothetical protein